MRNDRLESAKIVLDYFDGKPITDINDFNTNAINVYTRHIYDLVPFSFSDLLALLVAVKLICCQWKIGDKGLSFIF
jgi:hypothetical protein